MVLQIKNKIWKKNHACSYDNQEMSSTENFDGLCTNND